MWRHPNYYRELEKERKKLEQQLKRKGEKDERQASNDKQQAIDETVPHCDIEEATSDKRSETEQEGRENS